MDIFSLGVYSYHNLKKYNYDNFKLLCGPKPTTQVILAKKGNGETRGIIYFTTKRLDNSHIVSGIKTSDFKWNRIMENIIEFCQENNSFNALEKLSVFNWSEIQINRSLELFESQLSIKPSEIIVINSFNISIANGVFPPHMGKSTELLIKAIDLVCGKLKDNNKRICGVDIGTGTGILGLCLQRYCKNTILTDISERAIENARENFKRNSVSGKFYICNLLNDNIISSINSNEYPVSVFNYPFYPSLFTLSDENITGLQIIDEFIFKIKQVISDKGVVILPGNSIIGVNFDPSSIATKYGLHTHKTSISEEENFVYLIFSISQEKTYNFNCI